MVGGEQDKNKLPGSYAMSSEYVSEGSGKENYSDILKVCYPKCTKTMGRSCLR